MHIIKIFNSVTCFFVVGKAVWFLQAVLWPAEAAQTYTLDLKNKSYIMNKREILKST